MSNAFRSNKQFRLKLNFLPILDRANVEKYLKVTFQPEEFQEIAQFHPAAIE